jgi:hypothetical protein
VLHISANALEINLQRTKIGASSLNL